MVSINEAEEFAEFNASVNTLDDDVATLRTINLTYLPKVDI